MHVYRIYKKYIIILNRVIIWTLLLLFGHIIGIISDDSIKYAMENTVNSI